MFSSACLFIKNWVDEGRDLGLYVEVTLPVIRHRQYCKRVRAWLIFRIFIGLWSLSVLEDVKSRIKLYSKRKMLPVRAGYSNWAEYILHLLAEVNIILYSMIFNDSIPELPILLHARSRARQHRTLSIRASDLYSRWIRCTSKGEPSHSCAGINSDNKRSQIAFPLAETSIWERH